MMNDALKKKFINFDIYSYILITISLILFFLFIKFDQISYLINLELFSTVFFLILILAVIIIFYSKIRKNLVLFLIPPLFFIFIFEIFFGNWNSPHTSSIKKIKNTKLIQKNIWYKSKDNEDDKIEIFINNYGLRGKANDRALRDLDILFIGGSTTIQSTITDGKTFIDVLYNYFKKVNKKNLFFLNGGEDAHDTKSHIQSLKKRFKELKLKPKYILFFIGQNEGLNSHVYDRLLDIKNPLLIKIYNSSFVINKMFEARIYLGTLILNPYKFHKWHLNGYVPLENDLVDDNFEEINEDKLFEKKLIEEIQLELNNTKENIISLSEIVIKEYQSIPIFMNLVKATYSLEENKIRVFKEPIIDKSIVNLNHNHDKKINYYYPKVLANNIQNTCKTIEKAICIDAFNNSNLVYTDFHDFVHFKPSGAKKLGKLIFEKIQNEKF